LAQHPEVIAIRVPLAVYDRWADELEADERISVSSMDRVWLRPLALTRKRQQAIIPARTPWNIARTAIGRPQR
jgi:hypothetical protein